MSREILTNRWFLGGCGFLIAFGIACYFWYQHELAPYRQEAAKTQQQLEATQKSSPTNKTVNAVGPTSEGIDNSKSQKVVLLEKAEIDAPISPYGFGPYPDVPSDFPPVSWNDSEGQANLPDHANKNIELIERVLIKLWIQGDKSFHGSGSTHNGKVYPHYDNTVYVRYNKYELPDGTMQRYPTSVLSGPQVIYSMEDLLNPPDHLRILDLDSSGIDPYQFLNLAQN